MDSTLENKLRQLVDRDEIKQVLIRYGRGLDRLDTELTRSCYHDDAIEDHGHFIGHRDDFIDWANAVTARFERTQHAILNHFCDLKGDEAYTETYFQFIGVASQPPHLMSNGRYIDYFQKRDGEWRIAKRVTIVESHFDLSEGHYSSLMPPAYSEDETCPASRDHSDVSYHRPLQPRAPRDQSSK